MLHILGVQPRLSAARSQAGLHVWRSATRIAGIESIRAGIALTEKREWASQVECFGPQRSRPFRSPQSRRPIRSPNPYRSFFWPPPLGLAQALKVTNAKAKVTSMMRLTAAHLVQRCLPLIDRSAVLASYKAYAAPSPPECSCFAEDAATRRTAIPS